MKALRTILLALATTMMFSCGDDNDEMDGGNVAPDININADSKLTLEFSRQVIQANGKDASDFIVKVDGQQVTEGVTIYDKNDKPVSKTSFTTTEPGEYSFWATYKTLHSKNAIIKAISIAVPVLPADPAPENTEFKKKVMISQFTGTRCPYCPNMTVALRKVLENKEIKENVVLTAPHTQDSRDPFYIQDNLNAAFQVGGFPWVVLDLFMGSGNYAIHTAPAWITSVVKERLAIPAAAGIAAKSELTTNDKGEKQIALHVAVKAAVEGNYRVGAWLLEDSLKAKQANSGVQGDFDTHDNVVRIADSKGVGSSKYSGIDLGTIEAKKTAEHVFVMDLNPKWIEENMHIAIFVTSKQEDGTVPVVNVINCPIECEFPFNYAK